jgi:hypothetical protein
MTGLRGALGRLLKALVGRHDAKPPRSQGDHGASDWYARP